MDMNEYQEQALRTMSKETTFTVAVLGLAGESGEVCDLLKKALGQGHELDSDKIRKELGDILWYVAVVAHFMDTTLGDIAAMNVAKLKARYANGFDVRSSTERYVDDLIQKNAEADWMRLANMPPEYFKDVAGSPALD